MDTLTGRTCRPSPHAGGHTVQSAGSTVFTDQLGQDCRCLDAIVVVVSLSVVSNSCDPVDCSLPGSSVHGIFQARILEWVSISYPRGSSLPRDQTQVSCIAGEFFTAEPPGKTVWMLENVQMLDYYVLALLPHWD